MGSEMLGYKDGENGETGWRAETATKLLFSGRLINFATLFIRFLNILEAFLSELWHLTDIAKPKKCWRGHQK